MNESKILGLDCDGVLCDWAGTVLEHLNRLNPGKNLNTDNMVEDDFRKWPEWDERIEEIVRSAGFCNTIKPIPGVHEFIEKVKSDGWHVLYVTSPYKDSPTWTHDRTRWIAQEFGDGRDSIIYAPTGTKRFVACSTLVDDHVRNIKMWSGHNNRPAIMMEQPWNKKFRMDTENHRHSTWGPKNEFRHITGLKENYYAECAKNYDEILSILDQWYFKSN